MRSRNGQIIRLRSVPANHLIYLALSNHAFIPSSSTLRAYSRHGSGAPWSLVALEPASQLLKGRLNSLRSFLSNRAARNMLRHPSRILKHRTSRLGLGKGLLPTRQPGRCCLPTRPFSTLISQRLYMPQKVGWRRHSMYVQLISFQDTFERIITYGCYDSA